MFDSAKGIGGSPTSTVLPGKSVTYTVAFGLPRKERADLQVEVRPGFGFGYQPAIFTGQVCRSNRTWPHHPLEPLRSAARPVKLNWPRDDGATIAELTGQLRHGQVHRVRQRRQARVDVLVLVGLAHGGPLPRRVLGGSPEVLPFGRSQVGDRHLKFHEDNLSATDIVPARRAFDLSGGP